MNLTNIDAHKFDDEVVALTRLVERIDLGSSDLSKIDANAIEFVRKARRNSREKGLMENFLEEFGLSNNEGLALMCLAEALLRVPDKRTVDKLIAEKISSGDWTTHQGQSDNWLVNASTLGLMLTGKIVDIHADAKNDVNGFMRNLTRRAGSPIIRSAMMQAMRIMGEQFVLGRTIEQALARSKGFGEDGKEALCSFDKLGEGARTDADARRYYRAYQNAITALGDSVDLAPEICNGISVKLSALHPRYDALKEEIVFKELYPRLLELCQMAAKANINLCLDAEESERLIISLKLLEKLCDQPSLSNWTGLGLAVQAYQKRGFHVCEYLGDLAKRTNRRLMVRLVKGAYWDTEIKTAQVEGYKDYPVWTRKPNTDLAYLACARRLFEAGERIFPQFATHNAHTISTVQYMAASHHEDYEFQRLHGMGEPLYNVVDTKRNVRIYAPVGAHEDLLPYLVRRLLENGANTSFVHKFMDEDYPAEDVARSPFGFLPPSRHKNIAKPPELFGPDRKNALGVDLYSEQEVEKLEQATRALKPIYAHSFVKGLKPFGEPEACLSPVDLLKIGSVTNAKHEDVDAAYRAAQSAYPVWDSREGVARAKILRKMANALENQIDEFVGLMAIEAGKTFHDSIAEVREAVDFLRYYAIEAETKFSRPTKLPGPAGETNILYFQGRGVFACISPWNFPLAIFLGQIAAALAAGNTVLAKPAEQTPLVAFKAVELFYECGLPKDVLQLLLGDGDIGARMVALPNLAGVAFTGSTSVAKIINRALAEKTGSIPILIAETGGLNGMFVDTSALREQVIDDVVNSAFNAAGQRCSALRIVFLPDETADSIISGIIGAMDALVLGDPGLAQTDIGPVIDRAALEKLQDYVRDLPKGMSLLNQCNVPSQFKGGLFMPPTLIEVSDLNGFEQEQFGPILHVIRYKYDQLDDLMKEFASKGFGLTLGIHSRLESFVDRVIKAVPAGNVYINRNIIGAVVGVQPFGGRGLSGTGPKAGGPNYVSRFGTEVTITNNITAQGGDPVLLNLSE